MKNIFVFEHFQKKFKEVMSLTFNYMTQWRSIIKQMDLNLNDKNDRIKKVKTISEKDEEKTTDNYDDYQDKDEIIFNDDYTFT